MNVRHFAGTLIVAIAAPLVAQSHWDARLGDGAAALKAGQFERARIIADTTIAQMQRELGGGDDAERVFAQALTQRAVALAALGEKDEALWSWHEALAIRPLGADDVMPFGDAGAFLAANPPRRDFDALKPGGDLKPAKSRHRVPPAEPNGARAAGIDGVTVIDAVVDRTGAVSDMRIVRATSAPALTYAVMEALRQWTFVPGTRNGQPAEVVFQLTMDRRPR